jgi:hypothetical protein
MEYLDSDKAGTNGTPRPRTGRNDCEVCERALARTDTGMCDFCTVKQQRHAARSVHLHGRQSSARRASTRSRRAHHHQQRPQEGTTTMTDHDDQTPTRADFRRAAALYLHRRHHDHAGVNTILADADNRQRCSALVLAAIDLAFQSPYALASPAGIAGLQRVAVHMAQVDDDEHHRR